MKQIRSQEHVSMLVASLVLMLLVLALGSQVQATNPNYSYSWQPNYGRQQATVIRPNQQQTTTPALAQAAAAGGQNQGNRASMTYWKDGKMYWRTSPQQQVQNTQGQLVRVGNAYYRVQPGTNVLPTGQVYNQNRYQYTANTQNHANNRLGVVQINGRPLSQVYNQYTPYGTVVNGTPINNGSVVIQNTPTGTITGMPAANKYGFNVIHDNHGNPYFSPYSVPSNVIQGYLQVNQAARQQQANQISYMMMPVPVQYQNGIPVPVQPTANNQQYFHPWLSPYYRPVNP